MSSQPNVQQAVPFFMVSNMEASLRFYVEGLGFKRTKQWIPDAESGKSAGAGSNSATPPSCSRSTFPENPLQQTLGEGISVCFQCKDALAIYHEARARGLNPKTPFVGNGLWVTGFNDPDGYKLDFESPTDVPEETVYSDVMESPAHTQK